MTAGSSDPSGFLEVFERAEARLAALRRAMDPTIDGSTREVVLGLGLARRAGNLYDGALAIADLSPEGSMVIVRSLTEQAILMRWFEPDPVLRIRIWLAEDTRLRLATAIRMEELRRRRGQPALEVFSPDEIVGMMAEIDSARSAAIAAGLRRVTDTSKSLLPSIETMSRGQAEGWEAYQIAYRALNLHAHANARALVGDRVEERPDGLHLVSGSAWTPLHVRALALQSLAVAMAAGSRLAGLGIDHECDLIRDGLATFEEPSG